MRARLLRPRAGAVPRPDGGGAGLSQAERGQLGPGRPYRAGQRTGHRRARLAVGRAGRAPPAEPVVPEDHRLRRGTARRPRVARRLARQGPADAGKLDRQERRAAVHFRGRGRQRDLRRLHHPPRHAVRGELRGNRPRPSDRAAARRGQPRARRVQRRLPRHRHRRRRDRDAGEDGLRHRAAGGPPARPGA